jgi:hypothetical protein
MSKRKIIIECDDLTAKDTAELAKSLRTLVRSTTEDVSEHILVEGLTERQGDLFLPDWKTVVV